jgi:hypothetical protein
MGIGPIPNIVALPVKVPSATPADLPSTRAVEFYPKQEDSSYTPSQQEADEQDPGQQETAQQEADGQSLMEAQVFSTEVIENKNQIPDDFPDDPPAESTISLFA